MKFQVAKGRGKPKLDPKVEPSINLHKVLKLLDKYTTILRHTVLSYLSYLIFVCISKCADAQIHTLFITQIYTRFAEYPLGGEKYVNALTITAFCSNGALNYIARACNHSIARPCYCKAFTLVELVNKLTS